MTNVILRRFTEVVRHIFDICHGVGCRPRVNPLSDAGQFVRRSLFAQHHHRTLNYGLYGDRLIPYGWFGSPSSVLNQLGHRAAVG